MTYGRYCATDFSQSDKDIIGNRRLVLTARRAALLLDLATRYYSLIQRSSDWRKPLPANLPLGHVERRWRPHVVVRDGIDRTYWELATYFALSDALASGDIWVPTSRLHRSLDVLLTPAASGPATTPARLPSAPEVTADAWISIASA